MNNANDISKYANQQIRALKTIEMREKPTTLGQFPVIRTVQPGEIIGTVQGVWTTSYHGEEAYFDGNGNEEYRNFLVIQNPPANLFIFFDDSTLQLAFPSEGQPGYKTVPNATSADQLLGAPSKVMAQPGYDTSNLGQNDFGAGNKPTTPTPATTPGSNFPLIPVIIGIAILFIILK